MITPSIFYIYTQAQWLAQVDSDDSTAGTWTTSSQKAMDAHHKGLIVAYQAQRKFVQIEPQGWREKRD